MQRLLLTLLILLIVPVGLNGQSDDAIQQEEQRRFRFAMDQILSTTDSIRLGAYIDYDFPGSFFTTEIIANRANGQQHATARISYKFSMTSALRLTRIDFLSPAEVAEDVFIIRANEDSRRTSDVFFWNPELVSAIKIESDFEFFGDANVLELIGYKLSDGQYQVVKGEFSEETANIPHPKLTLVLNEGTVTKDAPIMVFDVEALSHRLEAVLYPKAQILSFLGTFGPIPYKIRFFDISGDLLQTITYDWRTMSNENNEFFGYAEEQIIENHLVPGNTTQLNISDVQVQNFPLELFDPTLLGQ